MISSEVLFFLLASLVLALLTVRAVRAYSLGRDLLALPNERSSHLEPTPSMGGLAVVLPVLLFSAFLFLKGSVLGGVLLTGGVVLAAVGLVDDLRGLSSRIRLVVHLSTGLLIWWVLIKPLLEPWLSSTSVPDMGIVFGSAVVAMLCLAWLINLYNFMDGTDGLAGSQCLYFCLAALWLSGAIPFLQSGSGGIQAANTDSAETTDLLVILIGAVLPFLLYNWPPAKIFMGDVGSGFLGFVLGVIIVQLALVQSIVPLVSLLILLTVFWVDASYTLCVRILTGQAFTAAHRSHLYQILARRWGHDGVLKGFWAFSLFWLTPLAWLSQMSPVWWLAWIALACLPVIGAGIVYKAGMPERIRESDRVR